MDHSTPIDVPILAGNYHSSRLFKLIGATISLHRRSQLATDDGNLHSYGMLGLPEISVPTITPHDLLDVLDRFAEGLPEPLKVPRTGTPSLNTAYQPAIAEHFNLLQSIVAPTASTWISAGDAPSVDEANDQAGLAACRANLLITHALARLLINRYAKDYLATKSVGVETETEAEHCGEMDVLRVLEL